MYTDASSSQRPAARGHEANLFAQRDDDDVVAMDASHELPRDVWVMRCASRLKELRPTDDAALIASVASDMWADVGAFDPAIAAEMEHEAWPWDNS